MNTKNLRWENDADEGLNRQYGTEKRHKNGTVFLLRRRPARELMAYVAANTLVGRYGYGLSMLETPQSRWEFVGWFNSRDEAREAAERVYAGSQNPTLAHLAGPQEMTQEQRRMARVAQDDQRTRMFGAKGGPL